MSKSIRVALSQRVDEVTSYRERRDALDQRWVPLLESLGLCPVPLPNRLADPAAWAAVLGIGGLLLSGGDDVGGSAPERDRTEAALLDLAARAGWPVLGICRGLQMMNLHLGGAVAPVSGHVAQRHHVRPFGGTPRWLDGAAEAEVNSYHAQGIGQAQLAPALQAVLLDDEGHVEAAEHRQRRWAALMWHPEREAVPAARDLHWIRQIFLPTP